MINATIENVLIPIYNNSIELIPASNCLQFTHDLRKDLAIAYVFILILLLLTIFLLTILEKRKNSSV